MIETKIRFEPEVLARLQRWAKHNNMPVAEFVRAIVDQFYARNDADREARGLPKN